MEKLRISRPVIVEGKYDKITLSSVMEGHILTTGGFSLFNQKEKALLLRRLAEEKGVIVLTDSDGGGRQIRSFLSGILPKEKVVHLYIPRVEGKERRKPKPGKAGILGVEGMDKETLIRLLSPYAEDAVCSEKGGITKADFFVRGLSGTEGAALARGKLLSHLSFPPDMTANALLEAINLLYTKDEFDALMEEIF